MSAADREGSPSGKDENPDLVRDQAGGRGFGGRGKEGGRGVEDDESYGRERADGEEDPG